MAEFIKMEIQDPNRIAVFLKRLSGAANDPRFRAKLLGAAEIMEEHVKEVLWDMVYAKPSGSYKRKMGAGLLGSTKATGKVSRGLNELTTGVASSMDYAVYVHMGTGVFAADGRGRKTPWIYQDDDGVFHRTVGQKPKPYLTKGAKKAQVEILKHLAKYFRN